ncbi:probable Vacuolar fusion protein MON1 [Cephalotrichum gorgonifer]|uniref:Vacuolar fusion protein MON1 n=1 Tax=Cephalotrichum gorgonifer TaxID=2041049 RepID=A0AAE8MRF6_9PEZI|nr:probable Vacuolar fusion protein MON1 [Cephalotrichum gorgonifer]
MGQDDTGPGSSKRGLDDETPPPLPPRPRPSHDNALQPKDPMHLQAGAVTTTAVSSIDIQTLSFPDGSRGTFSSPGVAAESNPSRSSSGGYITPNRTVRDGDDGVSVMSIAPTARAPGDIASLLVGEFHRKSPAWSLLRAQSAATPPFDPAKFDTSDPLADFQQEFDAIPESGQKGLNDGDRLRLWKSKLKHYMILSSSGKPIYSRHGDLGLINSSMGVVQTIISFYEEAKDPLYGFTAGDSRFVILTEGPLYLVAISRLGESDGQLRSQLEALYMQILSTLTLPTLKNIFVNRPSTDLRKPLEGTEPLLSSLADSFTRGSPSALLGALECLKLRKSQRSVITNTFLKLRTETLLYGMIVAGGKLVSVIRPRRHSLHPTDLQLIFNMLFECDNIRAGGGENWIPLCLPAFNNRGYLYMYVSFFGGDSPGEGASTPTAALPPQSAEEEIAIILVSPDKESFFELKQMRDNVAQQLEKNGSLAIVQEAARLGRPKVADVAPGSQVSHYLYKSRANVQFTMASLEPGLTGLMTRRRLMTLYHELHASMHAKHSHLKVQHHVSEDASALAWITPIFEFYCVSGPSVTRGAITQGANKIIQWAKREEERLFIIGGGSF